MARLLHGRRDPEDDCADRRRRRRPAQAPTAAGDRTGTTVSKPRDAPPAVQSPNFHGGNSKCCLPLGGVAAGASASAPRQLRDWQIFNRADRPGHRIRVSRHLAQAVRHTCRSRSESCIILIRAASASRGGYPA